MEYVLEPAVYNGITIDLIFNDKRPMFRDLFLICGYVDPNFPASSEFQFDQLSELGFSQVDDYFGIVKDNGEVSIWLYPVIDDKEVYHHTGPFTGLRLQYSILRNSPNYKSVFLEVVMLFAQFLDVRVLYKLRNMYLENPPDITIVENDIHQIIQFWKEKNIETGSENALKIAY